MLIIGCDFHTRYQQIAMMDEATGELTERRLEHENGEARRVLRQLARSQRAWASKPRDRFTWFERMLAELGHELWIGHASEIRAGVVRKQKTDKRDAAHLLDLLLAEAVSADLDSVSGRAGHAATVAAPSQAGLLSHFGEEPVARAGDEPGTLPKKTAVHREGPRAARGSGAGRVVPFLTWGWPSMRTKALSSNTSPGGWHSL